MVLADVQTTASTAGIWAIVIVGVIFLAFYLFMVCVIAPRPDRPSGRVSDLRVAVLGGTHLSSGGRSLSPRRDELATVMATIPGQRQDAGVTVVRPGAQEGTPIGTPMPMQREPAADQPTSANPPDQEG